MSEDVVEYKTKNDVRRKRNKQIIVRTTEEEFGRIKRKIERSRLSQNDFMIRSALDKDIIVIEGIKDLLVETRRIGNNINQLTKLAHQGEINHLEDLEEMKKELDKIWQSLSQLIQNQM